MLHKMFSVYDTKAEAWLPPFFLPTLGMAQRMFADCVNDIRHAFSRHPADYTLFLLGSFDDGSAVYTAEVAPVVVAHALELVSHEERLPFEDGE